MTTPPPANLVDKARVLLHKNLRITLTDGRVLVGSLDCLDKDGNIVLRGTHVYRKQEGPQGYV